MVKVNAFRILGPTGKCEDEYEAWVNPRYVQVVKPNRLVVGKCEVLMADNERIHVDMQMDDCVKLLLGGFHG